MTPRADIIDISHADGHVDFGTLKAAGVVGVIIKASQGSAFIDPLFADNFKRAVSVFGLGFVHAYHFLDDSPAQMQVAHFLDVTAALQLGRWLDFERNGQRTANEQIVSAAVTLLASKQGRQGGIYGSDADLLGAMLDHGFLTLPTKWIACYGDKCPKHRYTLWQWGAGESNGAVIGGKRFDSSQFNGTVAQCKAWMPNFAGVKPNGQVHV